MPRLEEGWLTVGLLCAMIVVAGGGVAAAEWTDGLQAAWITGLVGVLAGLALAKSRFSGATAVLFATVYGLFVVGIFIGLGLEGNWNRRSLELVIRINNFLYKAIHGGTSRDPLPFPVAVSLIFWYIGILQSWSVFRRGAVWPAVIPAGVGLMINAYYYLGPARLDLYLAVYVLLALMFVARMNLLDREREWQTARVLYSADLRLDFLRAGLAAALVGVTVAWAAPGLAASPEAASTWREMTGSLRVVRESWMRMFAAIRGYGQAYSDFYGESLALGGPARLSNEPIMDVRAQAITTGDEDTVVSIPERFYWRAVTFANYADGSWTPGEVEYREFDPNQPGVMATAYGLRREMLLTFTMHAPAVSRMYVAQQVQWLDRPSTWELAFDPNGSRDVTTVRAQQVVRRGEAYQVVASMSVADVASLRSAGTDYPAWVSANFLQLPEDITPRTRALAQQIVERAGATTPYDQAEAITNWLRQNVIYDQNIDAPPPDAEPVDHLLFTSLRGYCNYYATATVVMLRSLGVPARMAAGMAQGTFDSTARVYHVTESNAHAWPEVFFPGYGWIEFEPTVSEAPIVRPERIEQTNSNATEEGQEEEAKADLIGRDELTFEDRLPTPTGPRQVTLADLLRRVPWAALGTVAAAAGVTAIVLALLSFRIGMVGWENLGRVGTWAARRRGRSLPTGVGLVYLQLERVASWLGLAGAGSTTPHERAEALSAFAPEAGPAVQTITEQYVTEQYSQRPADAGAALQAWLRVRYKLWHDAIRSYLLTILEEEKS
jgi:transglutaminase-like putative cysteine protease